jgi:cobalamin synthase
VKGFASDPGPNEWHRSETYKGLITLAVELLKMLALVNGGAAVAILTFCGNLASHGLSSQLASFKPALIWYCLGLAATVLTFLVVYHTQLQLYAEESERASMKPRASKPRRHQIGIWIGTLLILFSIGSFVRGSWLAANVINPPAAPTGIGLSPK